MDLQKLAKSSCNHCYGSGIRGVSAPVGTITKIPIICSCVKRREKRLRKENRSGREIDV